MPGHLGASALQRVFCGLWGDWYNGSTASPVPLERPAVQRELWTLAGLIWRHRLRYGVGVASLLIVDMGNLSVPWLIGRFIDEAKAQRLDTATLWRYVGLLVAIASVVAVFRYLWRMNIFGTARMVEFELRDRLFRHLQRMSARFYQRHSIGDLMAHATNDLGAIRGVLGEGIMAGADAVIMVSLTLVAMAGTIHWQLTLAALVPLPLLILFEWGLGRSIHLRFKAVQAAFGTLSERVQESLAGARVIKAFAQEQATTERFRQDNGAYYERYMALTRLNALNDPVITLLGGLSTVIALAYGGVLVLQGELTIGQFVAFNSYLGMLVWPMLATGWVINLVQRGTASLARIQLLLEELPDVADAPAAQAPEAWLGQLEIRNLSFRYAPELPEVLQGISVSLHPGQTLGIVGRTGSGKSTLANLIVRVYEPPEGTVFLDGRDVRTLRLQALRDAVGYVPQDGFLFSSTIAENIAFVPQPHERAAVLRAAQVAQLSAEVDDMPHGFETMLGERGITLSGGQRQRVSIARAVLKDAPMLVLDDCLSAVDTATEARILAELRPLMAQRTTIIISHRVSALQHADQILVLSEGRVVERGSHAELLALEGEYRRLYDRQAIEAAIEAVE